jgi:hypothetical protein
VSPEAVVTGFDASPNVTDVGPLTRDHVLVVAPGGLGNPSSLTLPLRFTELVGNVIVWSGPASTTGAWFATTWTVISSKLLNDPSFAVSRNT